MGHLDDLAQEIREVNSANGWNLTQPEDWEDDYKIPTILALVHSEVSEALEAFRKDDLVGMAEELCDVIIRVLDALPPIITLWNERRAKEGINPPYTIDALIREKIEYNKTRGFRHGGKRV